MSSCQWGARPGPRHEAQQQAPRSQLEMETDSPEFDRAAVAVVGRIADVLEIRGHLYFQRIPPEHSRARIGRPGGLGPVVELEYLLVRVGECAIAEEKAGSACGQVIAVR